MIIYHLALPVDVKTLYDLQDPPAPSLKRERDELYVREIIPPLFFSLVSSNNCQAINVVVKLILRVRPLLGKHNDKTLS